jgi:hypothetical protein
MYHRFHIAGLLRKNVSKKVVGSPWMHPIRIRNSNECLVSIHREDSDANIVDWFFFQSRITVYSREYCLFDILRSHQHAIYVISERKIVSTKLKCQITPTLNCYCIFSCEYTQPRQLRPLASIYAIHLLQYSNG